MTEVVTFDQARRRRPAKAGGAGFGSNFSSNFSSNFWGKGAFFNRRELGEILQSYSRGVIAGDWLDYAVDWNETGAIFAVYGQVSALPMYSIIKRGKQGRRQAGYQLLGRGGVLISDPNLPAVLKMLDSRRTALVKSDR